MKKINVLLVSLLMTGSILAQNEEPKKTAEERAQVMTENLANKVELSDEQKTRIEAINEQYIAEIRTIKADESKGEDQKKEAIKEVRKNWKDSVSEELTEEQRTKLKEARAEKPQLTTEQKAEKRAQHLTQELELNEEQSKQVLDLSLSMAKKMEATKADSNLSEDQKKQLFKDNRKEFRDSLSTILTPEQMEKYEELKKKKENHGKGHGKK